MRTNGHGKPVVALDIDGTMGDYHAHFLSFASNWIGRPMPGPETINPGLRLHRFMGVPLRTYRECKLAYRQGGLKRWMPSYSGVADAVKEFRSAGAEVWVCTTRPYLRLDNIDPDTREWIRRVGFKHDAIIYGEEKYQELKRQAGGRVAFVVDDEIHLYRRACRLFPAARVLLYDQPYNQSEIGEPRMFGWDSLSRAVVLSAIQQWKETNASTGSGWIPGRGRRNDRLPATDGIGRPRSPAGGRRPAGRGAVRAA